MQETPVCFLGREDLLGEGIAYPLQYSWASLVAQQPAVWETWVQSLHWEDPLEKGKATHSSILAWRIPWTTVLGVTKSWTRLSNFHFHSLRASILKPLSHLLFQKFLELTITITIFQGGDLYAGACTLPGSTIPLLDTPLSKG